MQIEGGGFPELGYLFEWVLVLLYSGYVRGTPPHFRKYPNW